MIRWLFWTLLLVTIVSFTQAKEPQTPPVSDSKDQSIIKAENTAASSQEKVTEPEEIKGIEKGQALHQLHCVTCHNSSVYTRKDRRIKEFDSLKTQVQTCATNLNEMWFEEEVMDVTIYLNATYYLFETEKVTE